MKFKTTAKAIRESYGKKIKIGYCDAAHLLHYHDPIAYTCGVYGWNFDVYTVNGVTICTGYRGMVGDSVNWDVLRPYEEQAKAIVNDWGIPYDEKVERVESLLNEFLGKV